MTLRPAARRAVGEERAAAHRAAGNDVDAVATARDGGVWLLMENILLKVRQQNLWVTSGSGKSPSV